MYDAGIINFVCLGPETEPKLRPGCVNGIVVHAPGAGCSFMERHNSTQGTWQYHSMAGGATARTNATTQSWALRLWLSSFRFAVLLFPNALQARGPVAIFGKLLAGAAVCRLLQRFSFKQSSQQETLRCGNSCFYHSPDSLQHDCVLSAFTMAILAILAGQASIAVFRDGVSAVVTQHR